MEKGVFTYFRTYKHWLVVESDDDGLLERLRSHIPTGSGEVSEIDPQQAYLARCGACGWEQRRDDAYNYFGCPNCKGKG